MQNIAAFLKLKKFATYIRAIPPVPAATPSLKFSVGLIIPVLYKVSITNSILSVYEIAVITIPS